jgi:hypothetical protein
MVQRSRTRAAGRTCASITASIRSIQAIFCASRTAHSRCGSSVTDLICQ